MFGPNWFFLIVLNKTLPSTDNMLVQEYNITALIRTHLVSHTPGIDLLIFAKANACIHSHTRHCTNCKLAPGKQCTPDAADPPTNLNWKTALQRQVGIQWIVLDLHFANMMLCYMISWSAFLKVIFSLWVWGSWLIITQILVLVLFSSFFFVLMWL